jgi:hypothetical protein
MRMLLIVTMVLAFAVSASAQMTMDQVADFEGGLNNGDWGWGPAAADVVEPEGGNPGGYLGNAFQDTYYPILECGWDAPGWCGNLSAAGASHISGDFITIASSNEWIGSYYFTVLFRNHMGTINDVTDDVYVYIDPYEYTSPGIGEGWKHYDFDLPFDFDGAPGELPAGWVGGSYYSGNATFPSDVTFQDVVSNVGRIEFWYNHPDWGAIFASFNTGADNIILTLDSDPVAVESSSFGDLKAMFR